VEFSARSLDLIACADGLLHKKGINRALVFRDSIAHEILIVFLLFPVFLSWRNPAKKLSSPAHRRTLECSFTWSISFRNKLKKNSLSPARGPEKQKKSAKKSLARAQKGEPEETR
jgi:hypothetical protein